MWMVAQKAGVSKVTVSLSLRNHPSIPESTRRRIRKLARDMGYRTNPLVSALMAQLHTRRNSTVSPLLGLILDERDAAIYRRVPFYADLLTGARQRAAHLGYELEDSYLTMEKKAAAVLSRRLHAKNVRGVIIAPLFQPAGECPLPLGGFACCALGYSLHAPEIHRVAPNYPQTMRLVWSKLRERGYRRPGFISSLDNLKRTYFERLGAFTAQQAAHPELAAIPPLIFKKCSDDCVDECLAELLAWFHRHRPDVLVFPPWFLLGKLRQQLRIPEQAGVILADAEPGWAQAKEGALQIGAAAVDMVLAQIHRNETGVPPSPKTMAINSIWVEGFSLPPRPENG